MRRTQSALDRDALLLAGSATPDESRLKLFTAALWRVVTPALRPVMTIDYALSRAIDLALDAFISTSRILPRCRVIAALALRALPAETASKIAS